MPSATQSPSPILPLCLLLLVLFMAVGPWFMTSEPALEQAMRRARRSSDRRAVFPAETLILVPAIILVLFQFYGAYERSSIVRTWRVPQFKLNDSFLAVLGFLVVAIVLSWMRSSVKEMVQSL